MALFKQLFYVLVLGQTKRDFFPSLTGMRHLQHLEVIISDSNSCQLHTEALAGLPLRTLCIRSLLLSQSKVRELGSLSLLERLDLMEGDFHCPPHIPSLTHLTLGHMKCLDIEDETEQLIWEDMQ